eukprot:SAG31_NODE_2828_length_5028_cov_6.670116_2_plen_49_part_01
MPSLVPAYCYSHLTVIMGQLFAVAENEADADASSTERGGPGNVCVARQC